VTSSTGSLDPRLNQTGKYKTININALQVAYTATPREPASVNPFRKIDFSCEPDAIAARPNKNAGRLTRIKISLILLQPLF
jgi:hypothetical protein